MSISFLLESRTGKCLIGIVNTPFVSKSDVHFLHMLADG